MNPLFEKMYEHFGHDIECVVYGEPENPVEVSIECTNCNAVIVSEERVVSE